MKTVQLSQYQQELTVQNNNNHILNFGEIICTKHTKQICTHFCTENKCQNNPFICAKCVSQGLKRSYHYGHEDSIFTLEEGIRIFSNKIRIQANPVAKIYRSTLGRNEYYPILQKLEKGDFLQEQLNQRIISLKKQIQTQLNSLLSQFQRILSNQKKQYFNLLDNYQKIYIRNYDYIRTQTKALLNFQSSIKYFSNENNLSMKIIKQSQKKTSWIVQMKRNLLQVSRKIQTSGYITEINQILSSALRKNIDTFPFCKSSHVDSSENERKYKQIIKQNINKWAQIPQIVNFEEEFMSKASSSYQKNKNSIKKIGKPSNNSIGYITKNYTTSHILSKF